MLKVLSSSQVRLTPDTTKKKQLNNASAC
jgi:hypothetical protein